MIEKGITTQKWLNIIGKDKLQSYQDSYALMHGISLGFFNGLGEPITVWSNESLFCRAVKTKTEPQCEQAKKEGLIKALEDGEYIIDTCYLGITNFFMPIYFDGNVVAYCVGGGVVGEDSYLTDEILTKYHITKKNRDVFTQIMRNFQLSINMINLSLTDIKRECCGDDNKSIDEVLGEKLSKRELDVTKAICEGMSNKQVAERLFISEKTVKSHVSNILMKLDLRDRVQLVAKYSRYL